MKKGENQLVQITLYQQDGSTPLPVSSLDTCTVSLKQNGAIIVTYTLGTDNQVRGSSNILEVEITKSVSANLRITPLVLEIFLQVTDADFDVDGVQYDKKCIEISVTNC